MIETKKLLKEEPEELRDCVDKTVPHVEDVIENVEMRDLMEEPMKCFHCDDLFGSILEMEDHLSEKHQIDREAVRAFNKWYTKKTDAMEGKNEFGLHQNYMQRSKIIIPLINRIVLKHILHFQTTSREVIAVGKSRGK